ncbi:uncharacterized protein BDW43DRAFT_56200 [Aspergillus alliaceus]|uniref:uncharacterized protein n=1 Tax=Petromyces alliaceus TaxID=209559 RepID=UPI0012A5016B|nr:uncharacterized protein BDW43DRAFT_56200 [Aspergillus alliaceus]KAB8234498.1 hypothetical protein BDW43DRAFT_56200 [Aspergillus alliaceus]
MIIYDILTTCPKRQEGSFRLEPKKERCRLCQRPSNPVTPLTPPEKMSKAFRGKSTPYLLANWISW